MLIEPLFDRVLLKEVKDSTQKSSAGLILPETNQEKPLIGEVVAVGSGLTADGKQVDMAVNVNDRVVYSKYAGINFRIDGTEVVLIRQSDILARITN